MSEQNVTVAAFFWTVVLGVIGFVATAGIQWGTTQSHLGSIDDKLTIHQKQLDKIATDMDKDRANNAQWFRDQGQAIARIEGAVTGKVGN